MFSYNKNDQLVSTGLHRVDTLNGVDSHEITLYEYDGRNLVTREVNAMGDSTIYVYDGNGNMVSKTDADGYVTQYSYTALDLVKKINYNGAKEVSYQYNKVGELVQMNDWTGTNTFELDLLGRLQKMTDHKGNTVSYAYDAVGNQTSITYPDGSKVSNFYDAVYNLTSVIDAEKGTYVYVYDDANRPVKLTYPNGWVEQYTYDAEGNLLKTVDTDPFQLYNKTPKVKYEYTYDAEGNALTKFQRDSDATENLKSRTAFTYDALNRLTGSTRRLEVYPYDTLAYTYTYDTLGNLLKQSGPTKGEEDTYQYNDLNQMVSKHVCGYEQKLTRIYDYGYTYDKRGNLVKEEEVCSPTTTGPRNITIATYLYDETNRMVQGTNKTGEVSAYTFNGLGVRVGTEQILQDNSHGYTDFHCQTPSVETGIEKPEVVKTDYVIDYTRLGIDQRVLVKSEQDGYDFRYTYGLDKVKVYTTSEGSDWWGQNIHKCVNADYVHTDRLGSVVNLSDERGRVTARTDYTDWGEVRKYTDITVDQGFRRLLPEITYATHEYDDVLNQFYAKARMYDAENKRFMQEDPARDNTNWYIYCGNNPLHYVDWLGLAFEISEAMQRAIDENRLYGAGTIAYGGKTYDVYVPVIKPQITTLANAAKLYSYDTSSNVRAMPSGYKEVFSNSRSFSYFDWASAIAGGNVSLEDIQEGSNSTMKLDAISSILGGLSNASQYIYHLSLKVSLYEEENGMGRLAKIELRNNDLSSTIKSAAGSYYEVFRCTQGGTKIYRFLYDSARAKDQYLHYIYASNGNLNAYTKKYSGDNMQILRAHFFKSPSLEYTYGQRYASGLKIESGLDKAIKNVLGKIFNMTIRG